MEVVSSGALALRSRSVRKVLVSVALCISMVVGAAAQPAAADSTIRLTVGDKTIVLDLEGVQLTIDQVQELIDQITDFILEKEAALVAELVTLLEVAAAILDEVVIPFLEGLVDDLIDLVITLKLNVEAFVLGVIVILDSVCVTTQVDVDPSVCVVLGS